jgi:predicted phosphohydrolase
VKLAVFSDTHLYSPIQANKMKEALSYADKDTLVLHLGDVLEAVALNGDMSILSQLKKFKDVMYLLGNHDMWRAGKQTRSLQQVYNQALFPVGKPLQSEWVDDKTAYTKGNVTVIGYTAFPDLKHPSATLPREFYLGRFKDYFRDPEFMPMEEYLYWADAANHAFSIKLGLALESNPELLIIATHYPVFDSQVRETRSEILPYCIGSAGNGIMIASRAHRSTKFLCLSGHAHSNSSGSLDRIADNVYTYGMQSIPKNSVSVLRLNTRTLFDEKLRGMVQADEYIYSMEGIE